MKRTPLVAIILLVFMDLGVISASDNHPEPLSVFKDSNLLYKIHKPISAGFESSDSENSNEAFSLEDTYKNFDDSVGNVDNEVTLSEVDSNDIEQDSNSTEKNEKEEKSSILSHIPTALKMVYSWKTLLTDFIDTVHKATRIYQEKKAEMHPNANVTEGRAMQHSPLPSALLDIALNPHAVGELVEVGRSAHSEDEALQGLTSVVLNSQGRSGSSLTLDPVTVIALLTLAAYLIRAVYQILITNNNGRSFDSGRALHLKAFELPENIAWILDTTTGLDFDDSSAQARSARALHDAADGNRLSGGSSGILALPGSVAAITKLRREGHSDCINLYTCEQLAHKDIFSYSLEDVLVVSMGAYLGDVQVWPLLSQSTSPEKQGVDRCAQYRGGCQQATLREAKNLRDLFTEASSKLLRLLSSARDARRRNHARRSSARSEVHT